MGNLKPFPGIHEAKPVFTITPRCYLPISRFYLLFSWCWHVHWWGKSNVGGNGAPWCKPGSWAQTTLVVGAFFTSCTSCKGTPPVSLKDVLDEAVKSINCLKSRLWVHLFLILHAVKWQEERTLNTPATYQGVWLSRGKTSRLLLDSGAGLATFFKEHHFCLKKKLTNYGYSALGIWRIVSEKWMKGIWNFRKTYWQNLWPWQNSHFQVKIRILKLFSLAPWAGLTLGTFAELSEPVFSKWSMRDGTKPIHG